MTRRSTPEHFWSRVQKTPTTEGCWRFVGCHNRDGYSSLMYQGRVRGGHQVAYETVVGDVPLGLQIDHLCRNRWCVNPWHLEAVTHAENTRRGRAGERQRARTHCPSGHEYSAENTGVSRGKRYCKTCNRTQALACYHRKQLALKALDE